jgi:outer membrane protein TolC
MAQRRLANVIRKLATAAVPVGMAVVAGFGCTSPERSIRANFALPSSESPSSEFASDDVASGARSTLAPSKPAPNTIDLGIALRLAGIDNPTIRIAQERVQEALADRLAARTLLLPTVNVGGNYRQHDGPIQAAPGYIRDVDIRSLYAGAGARTLAADTVAFPGIRLFAHLGDAVYEPLAAQQRVAARRSDAQAVQNAILLDVVTAYLELIGAEARHSVFRDGQEQLAEVVRLTAVYAEKGQGRQGEAQRAAANAARLARNLAQIEEEIAAASSQLSRLLSLDPAIQLQTPGGPVEVIRLIPEDTELESLVTAALRSRPEFLARSAEVMEAHVRVRQEEVRPWVPTLSVGYSAGAFGGGGNLATPDFSPLSGRSDFDVVAVWNFENLGLGNRARSERADAVVGQAVAGLSALTNQVRREVAEALAAARAAARQMEAARQALAPAEEGFNQESERIRQGEGRPIELLDSFRQLLESRQEILRAAVAFNIAQFRLFVAVGRNPLAAFGVDVIDGDGYLQCGFASFSMDAPIAGCSSGSVGSYPGSSGSGSSGGSNLFATSRE